MNTRNIRFRSNRVRDILALYHEELDPLYGPGEVRTFGEMLFEAFLGWDRVKLLTSRDHTVNQSDLLRLHWALEDLRRHRPIQHIIGHTDFCGCRIAVTPDVLIPRPETEEIVNWIATAFHAPHPAPRILDLCTGSGCIAIALKKAFPGADVTAVDLSPAALAVACQNAKDNGTEVNFVQSDILATPKEENKEENKEKNNEEKNFNFQFSIFNLIVSNPPYVRQSERAAMRRNVLDYEPEMALFVPDDDPLRFYRAIGALAARCLAPGGLLALEINQALAEETGALLQQQGFTTDLHTDFRGNARFITATALHRPPTGTE